MTDEEILDIEAKLQNAMELISNLKICLTLHSNYSDELWLYYGAPDLDRWAKELLESEA